MKQIEGYTVVTNSDRTEGRGHQMIIHYTLNKHTAIRLSQGKGIQGSDASVNSETFFIDEETRKTYGPIRLETPLSIDKKAEEEELEYNEVMDKVKALGLTEEEIKILKSK